MTLLFFGAFLDVSRLEDVSSGCEKNIENITFF